MHENEVVADLFAVNHSNYLPDRTLTATDVVVTDDRKPVTLTSFATSDQGSLRPLAVWLVAQCDLKGWQSSGSRFLHGRASTLAGGLAHLRPDDTVAAAGWCDNGQQQVGTPAHDIPAVIQNLEDWTAQQKSSTGASKRKGELTLQQMLRNISATVANIKPRPLPVLVFLHQDDTGTQGDEYQRILGILLEQSSIAFLITDGKGTYQPSQGYLAAGNIAHVLTELSADTGGSALITSSFEDHPNAMGEALASIVDRLHGRYQFSFVPQKIDGKVHALAVQLSEAGRAKHGGALLRTRLSYLAPRGK
ncbi:MAG: hypothetical protein INR71_15870 [Terriglobus roseus]|nr:hypothetical protein [Terriglobus roseus]